MSQLNLLIQWVQTFDLDHEITVDNCFDAEFIANILNQIDHNHFDPDWLGSITKIFQDNRNESQEKDISNFGYIINGIEQFYYISGKVFSPIFSMPDPYNIVVNRDHHDIESLIKLILGCAVASDNLVEFIERIKTLEINVQLCIKNSLEELNMSSGDMADHKSVKKSYNCEYKRQLETCKLECDELTNENSILKMKLRQAEERNTVLLNDSVKVESDLQIERKRSELLRKELEEQKARELQTLANQARKLNDELDSFQTTTNISLDQFKLKCQELIEVKTFLRNREQEIKRLIQSLDESNDKVKQKDHLIKTLREKLETINEEFASSMHEAVTYKADLDRTREQMTEVAQYNEQLRRKSELYLNELNEAKLQTSQYSINYAELEDSCDYEEACLTLTPGTGLDPMTNRRASTDGPEAKARATSMAEAVRSPLAKSESAKQRSASLRSPPRLASLLSEIRETTESTPKSSRTQLDQTDRSSSPAYSEQSFATAVTGSEERIKALEVELQREKDGNSQLAKEKDKMKQELTLLRSQIESLKNESQRAAILEHELEKTSRLAKVQSVAGTYEAQAEPFLEKEPSSPSIIESLASKLLLDRAPKKPTRTFEDEPLDEMFEFVEHSQCNLIASSLSLSAKRKFSRKFEGNIQAAQQLIGNLEKQNQINMKRIVILQARIRDYEQLTIKSSKNVPLCSNCKKKPAALDTVQTELDHLKGELEKRSVRIRTLEARLKKFDPSWKWDFMQHHQNL